MNYLLSAIERTGFEIAILFGGVFALATALWHASQRLRGDGYGRFGDYYYLFVAPGVACHETGHAFRCILTGTKIHAFVPFRLVVAMPVSGQSAAVAFRPSPLLMFVLLFDLALLATANLPTRLFRNEHRRR